MFDQLANTDLGQYSDEDLAGLAAGVRLDLQAVTSHGEGNTQRGQAVHRDAKRVEDELERRERGRALREQSQVQS